MKKCRIFALAFEKEEFFETLQNGSVVQFG